MYAVVEMKGQQFKVEAGKKLFINRMNEFEKGATVEFEKVLLIENEGKVKVGAPYVEGAAVTAEVIGDGKAKKVVVYKYKPKKGFHKKRGHRQPFTKLQIKSL